MRIADIVEMMWDDGGESCVFILYCAIDKTKYPFFMMPILYRKRW